MSTMIERVAKALIEQMFAPQELPLTDELQNKYYGLARAAIAAMREPTDLPHVKALRIWRNEDQADSIVLSRHDVCALLDEIDAALEGK